MLFICLYVYRSAYMNKIKKMISILISIILSIVILFSVINDDESINHETELLQSAIASSINNNPNLSSKTDENSSLIDNSQTTVELAIPEYVSQFSFFNPCSFTTNVLSNKLFIAASYIKDDMQMIHSDNNAAAGTVYTYYEDVDNALHQYPDAKTIYAKDYYASTSSGYEMLKENDIRLKYFGNIGRASVKVEYINYWNDDREPNPKWIEYFRRQIEQKIGYTDTPILISDAWLFEYNGTRCAVVNATNLEYTLENTPKFENLLTEDKIPSGNNHITYMCSALFIGEKNIYDIFRPYCEHISNQFHLKELITENQKCWYSFTPSEDNIYHTHLTIQRDSTGNLCLNNYYDICDNDNKIIRNFFIYDIDADGYLEMIFSNNDERGGYYNFYSIYKITENALIPIASL